LGLSGAAAELARLLSGNLAVFLWWFSLAVFDDEFRLDTRKLGVGATWFVVWLLDRSGVGGSSADVALTWILVTLGFGMVAHVAYRLLRDLNGDLIVSRRRARAIFATVLAALLLVDLGVDVVLGFDWTPQWFTVAQNAVILLVAACAASWLLRPDVGALTFQPSTARLTVTTPAPARALRSAAAGADARLLHRLHELMESERIYRDPNLTVAQFAARMGAPEAKVRSFVNQQLGHRHFRNFLNAYRVAEARQVLADPAKAGEKMVTIALDVGFASLASFNRAFKLAEGRPPTEFRTDALAAASPARNPAEGASEAVPASQERELRSDCA
jgi:AraC-like DNA-binding protein